MKNRFTLLIAVFTLLLSATGLQAQQQDADSLYLNIVIPEQDTVTYSWSRYRVAANTHPSAKAFINSKEVKVYSTGAFVDLIDHEDDTTRITFRVEMDGESLSKTMMLVRPEAEEITFSGKEITGSMMRPGDDRWLQTGEVLEVQFRGTPGQKAVFNIDGFKRNIPMYEVPVDFTGGREGVYRGKYTVKAGDQITGRNITFKMRKNFFSWVKKTSESTVSFNGLPRTGEVTDKEAYLNIGMGTDRLGGAKYGSIEKGVRLNITGLKNDNYRVQLTKNLNAWIPVRFVELLPVYEESPSSLAGNIRATAANNQDIVTLSLGTKLPYISTQQLEPNRIIVDVFGATSNTNWKTMLDSAEGIRKIDWEQVEDDRYRLIIELDHKQNWGYTVGYGWGSQLQVKINRPPAITNMNNPLEGRTITVDAGHGGSSNGALGAAGFMEKEVTLQISEKLDSVLTSKGVNVVMTRTDDSYVYMSERKDITAESGADMLVSIHANSIGYGSDPVAVGGTGAFYKHMAYRPLAEIMYRHMRELGLRDYGMTGSFNFSLNAPIAYPNVLVETAFISNPEEEVLLTDPAFQVRIAEQIAAGLKEYYLNFARLVSVDEMPDK